METKKPKKFITCPRCQAKSKVLRTEFGGLQTRQCSSGHVFEYDKWLADRAFWGPITASGTLPKLYRNV